jgi:quercetin dioxygenase-like cupin family protein
MAQQAETITNPRTGQQMTFISQSPDELRIDSISPPTGVREPRHVHPVQESGCEVLSGVLVWEVAGVRRFVAAGEAITVPANTAHTFWNEGPDDAHAIQFLRPALNAADFFETLFELARRDELDSRGMPKLLAVASMVTEFGDTIRPVSPPWPVLRALAAALGPIAKARGYHAGLRASR